MNKIYRNTMKISEKLFFAIVLFLFAGHTNFAQEGSLQKDTLMVKVKKTESTGNAKEQNIKKINNEPEGKVENNAESRSIKQVKAARPDMSRARGARPPDIVRPIGSRIPQGVGRPGGAVRPGRR
ncbi:MAG: hypothetical protein NTX93_01450 [Bacteroidia bacterium]|nr:hypothetical protein [Bacteroidia bacterium]